MNDRPGPATRRSSVLSAYIELTKPRIIELLLITTIPAMFVAADGWPGLAAILFALIGGTLSAGGANVINQVYDGDIDRIMSRTRHRPIPTNRVSPAAATIYGLALGAAGFLVLWFGTTHLAGMLSLVAYGFYVLVYTMVLKRSSTQNIVIGGAAGAVPALIGWSAVTGDLSIAAWVMFAIIFFWTPPHFWALSIKYKDDYRAAGVPMFPVVAGRQATFSQIQWYSLVTVGVTLLLVPTAGLGWVYAAMAVASGIPMVIFPVRIRLGRLNPMRYFGYTNIYLATVFTAMMVDRLVLDGPVGGTAAWAVVGTALVAMGLAGVVTVEAQPAVRVHDIHVMRHAGEVGVTLAFAVVLVVAVWRSITG
ncbi:MAG: heme o synthase [Actinomycetota bacterium]